MMFDDAVQQALSVKGKAETAIVKLGTVTSVSNGRALVQHYGESTPSTKKYTAIDGYFPEVGDKVAMLPQGNTYIIIGKVIDAAPVQKYATITYVDDVAAGLLPIAYKNKLEDSEHSTESLTFSNYVLLPTTNDKDILGSSSKYFKEAYINKLYLNGTEYSEISVDRIVIKSGGTTYSLVATVSSGNVNLTPSSNDKWILGSKSYQLKEAWLGLFRGSWKSGNTTERQVSWNSSNALVPDKNNSVDLGSANYTFKQLFLNALVGAKFQYQSGSTYNIAWANASDIQPSAADVVNLGASEKQFNKVYAKEFYINGTKLDISGITTDNLVTKYGTTEYKLTLSIKSAGTSGQYEALEPSMNEKFDLGSSSYKFRNIYLTTWAYSSSRNISWDTNSNIIPDTTNAVSLGTSSKQYDKVYAKEYYIDGALLDLSQVTTSTLKAVNGSYTRTITLTASSSGAKLSPSSNNTYNIGEYNYQFKEMFASYFCGSLRNYTSSINYQSIEWDSFHNFSPSTDNTVSLGTSSKQFKNIYGKNLYANGTAVTSDRNLKKDIVPLSERYEEFFKLLKPVGFKYIDGNSGRTHTGFIAQEVEEAAKEAGLDGKDIAVVVKDEDDSYFLRYTEIIAIQTQVIQKMQTKVDELEARIARLESLIERSIK